MGLASAVLVVVAVVAGCSSSGNSNKDGSSGSGGYGPTTKLVDLSRADLNQLCAQESANGTGTVSCGADASVNVTPLGVCTSIAADCSATVATSQACADAAERRRLQRQAAERRQEVARLPGHAGVHAQPLHQHDVLLPRLQQPQQMHDDLQPVHLRAEHRLRRLRRRPLQLVVLPRLHRAAGGLRPVPGDLAPTPTAGERRAAARDRMFA